MKTLVRMAFLFSAGLLIVGCTDAEVSQWYALNEPHRVELWSGGQLVREWKSTGKVLTEESSDGYYFRDAATKQLVRVTGDLVITPIEEGAE